MADTTKGQASPRAHFFHVAPSHSDNKWRVKEVRANGAIACDTKEKSSGNEKWGGKWSCGSTWRAWTVWNHRIKVGF